MTQEYEGLLAELKEIVLLIRQYLCNTEFAPEPFTEAWDPNKLTVEFPNQILAKAKPILLAKGARLERERIISWGNEYCRDEEHIKWEGSTRQRRLCSKCWQALKQGKMPEEVKDVRNSTGESSENS